MLQKTSHRHDGVIDLMLAHPELTNAEIAEVSGYSEGWISTVRSADVFRMRLDQRRQEVVDPLIAQEVKERLINAANLAAERMLERLQKPDCSEKIIISAAKFGSQMVSAIPAINPTFDETYLENIAYRLRTLYRHRTGEVLIENERESEITEVSSADT